MKLEYWLNTPENTKEFIESIEWDIIHQIFIDYVEWLWIHQNNNYPKTIKIWWIRNLIENILSLLRNKLLGQDEYIWGFFNLYSGKIQVNTRMKASNYLLLQTIIHELVHSTWYNYKEKERTWYSIREKFNDFNEWVTQKITEEIIIQYLDKIKSSKEIIYTKQITNDFITTILNSKSITKLLIDASPSLKESIEKNKDRKNVKSLIYKEISENGYFDNEINKKVNENTNNLSQTYENEITIVDNLISELSNHSWKDKDEIWKLIKKWYFEWISIIKLCTSHEYWFCYDKDELLKIIK